MWSTNRCVKRIGSSIAVACGLPILLSGPVLAGDRQAVIVKDTVVSKDVVLVNIAVRGKSAQLSCFLSVAHCKVPKPGDYLLVQVPPDKSVYMDCPNVDLFSSVKSQTKEKVGEYCFLGE